jgi:anti-sigma factor ChrR (cupin superfamily)
VPCPSEETLIEFAEGTLPEERGQRIEEHLEICSACCHAVSLFGLASASRRTPLDPDEALLAPGDGVDRYQILGFVGAGAMGIIYAAYDPRLDRKIALKLLHPHHAARANAAEGLAAEARAIAQPAPLCA